MVVCVGENYNYVFDVVDIDFDLLVSVFVQFWGGMNGGVYVIGFNFFFLVFEFGFSLNFFILDVSFQVGNVFVVVNFEIGEIFFLLQIIGIFVIKIVVGSYCNGVLIVEVEWEIQMIVQNCIGNNNVFVVNGFFGGSFIIIVIVGIFVNFIFVLFDLEVFQDGLLQINIFDVLGLEFGVGFIIVFGFYLLCVLFIFVLFVIMM